MSIPDCLLDLDDIEEVPPGPKKPVDDDNVERVNRRLCLVIPPNALPYPAQNPSSIAFRGKTLKMVIGRSHTMIQSASF